MLAVKGLHLLVGEGVYRRIKALLDSGQPKDLKTAAKKLTNAEQSRELDMSMQFEQDGAKS